MRKLLSQLLSALFPTPAPKEDEITPEERKLLAVLTALAALDKEGSPVAHPFYIHQKLRAAGQYMPPKEMLSVCGKAVEAGFVQRIGSAEKPSYALSENGRDRMWTLNLMLFRHT